MKEAIAVIDPVASGNELLATAEQNYVAVAVSTIADAVFMQQPQFRPPPDDRERYHELRIPGVPTCEIATALVASCRALGARPAAIIPGSEIGVEIAPAIAKQLDLPHNELRSAETLRHKGLMKATACAAGLRHPAYRTCRTSDEALQFARGLNASNLVLKTPAGGGGTDMTCVMVANSEEFHREFDRIRWSLNMWGQVTEDVVAEELIEGREFAVNLFANGSGTYVTDIWEYHRDTKPPHAWKNYSLDTLVPSGSREFGLLAEIATRIPSAFGITRGPVHAELFLTGNDHVIFGEAGARFGGGRYPHLVRDYAGVDLFAGTIESFRSAAPIQLPVVSWPTKNGMPLRIALVSLSLEAGKVLTAVAREELDSYLTTLSSFVRVSPRQGYDVVGPTRHSLEIPATVWLATFSDEQLTADIARCRAAFEERVRSESPI